MAGEETSGAGAAATTEQITGGAQTGTLLTDKPAEGADAAKAADKPAEGEKKEGEAAKPDAEKKEGEKKDEKPAGAPEKYEAPKLPEGITVDEVQLGEFNEIAKKHGLTQEAYQEMIDHYVKLESAKTEQVTKAWTDQGKAWADAVKADKEIGGEKFQESVSAAKQVLDKFGSKELVADLVRYQMGNHPELIRLLTRVHAAVKDDTFVVGGKNTGASQDVARTIFPTMKNL